MIWEFIHYNKEQQVMLVQDQYVDHLKQQQILEQDGRWVRFRIRTYNLKQLEIGMLVK